MYAGRCPGAVNRAAIELVQRHDVVLMRCFIIQIVIKKATPTPADANDFHIVISGVINHGFNGNIQTRNIATSC